MSGGACAARSRRALALVVRAGWGRNSRALVFAAAAAVLWAAPRAPRICGKSGEGFSEWLRGFHDVAVGNGVSAAAVARGLDGVTYDPSVKAHDHGAAGFGHNFASFAASHVTPGMVSRGRAMLKKYAEPLAHDRGALRGSGAGRGGDLGPGDELRRRQRQLSDLQCARDARLGLPPARAVPRRTRRRADSWSTVAVFANPRSLRGAWAGEVGQTQLMPSAMMMYATTPDGTGTPDVIHNSADALASAAAFLKGHGWQPGAGLERRRAQFPGDPWLEQRDDLREDRGAVARPACRKVTADTSVPRALADALVRSNGTFQVGLRRWNMRIMRRGPENEHRR